MSVRIMSAVFDNEELGPTERLVMLALADHADDEGRCYPSISRLCKRTGLQERAVQTNIKKLVSGGYLTVEMNAGKRGTNLYTVHPTPARNAPPHEMHPALDAPHPRTKCTPTPAPDAPEPSVTVNEPSSSIGRRRKPSRKTRISDDAEISEKMLSIAVEERVSQREALAQFDSFKGHALANGKTYADWDAAWRNWLRSPFFKPLTQKGTDNGKRSVTERIATRFEGMDGWPD